MVSTKIRNNIDRGLWVEYGILNNYIAAVESMENRTYNITYHHTGMPSHASEVYMTLEELEVGMRNIQSDLRRWKLAFV